MSRTSTEQLAWLKSEHLYSMRMQCLNLHKATVTQQSEHACSPKSHAVATQEPSFVSGYQSIGC